MPQAGSSPHRIDESPQMIYSVWFEFCKQCVLWSDYSRKTQYLTICKQMTSAYLNHSQNTHSVPDCLREMNLLFVPSTSLLHNLDPSILDAALQYWLEIGSDLESRALNGETPLLYAIRRGSQQYASMLVKYGADVQVVDNDGNGAVHLAMRRIHYFPAPWMGAKREAWERNRIQGFLSELLRRGCYPYAINHDGQTPLQYIPFDQDIVHFWNQILVETMYSPQRTFVWRGGMTVED